MIVTLQTERIRTIGQVAAFAEANELVEFQPLTIRVARPDIRPRSSSTRAIRRTSASV